MPGLVQINYDKALKDFKYAEEQRRAFKKRLTSAKESLADLEAKQKDVDKRLKTANDDMARKAAASINDPTNTTKASAYKTAQIKVNSLNKEKTGIASRINFYKNATSNYQSVLTKLTDITSKTSTVLLEEKKGSGDKGTTGENVITGGKRPSNWVFNAPPARAVYFTPNSLQTRNTESQSAYPLPIIDALKDTFKGTNINRGAIQMNELTALYLSTRMKGKKDIDTANYGFRFHYNPSSVYLGYGAMDKMSPELMRDEMQYFNPVVPTSLGEINFDLYLNRINDLHFLLSDGSISVGGATKEAVDVYPEFVSVEARKEIYTKGTMYDLEYLFRAIHGGLNDVNSKLRGKKTADIGWIARVPVEVHLGDGLRYLLSVNTIGVNHILFNDRMVPTLSVVKISGSRFFDSVEASKAKITKP